jgi:hypothetical protein
VLQLDTPTLDLAISRVLKQRRAHEHEKFSLSQLVRDWHSVGLRHADLNATLQSLASTGCLRRVSGGNPPLYILTSAGIERLFSPVLPLEDMPTYARDVALLAQVQARPHDTAMPAQPQRRRGDRSHLRYGRWQSDG